MEKSLDEILALQGDILCLSEILGTEQLTETKRILQEHGFSEIYSVEAFQLPRDPHTKMYNVIGSRSHFTLRGSFCIPGGSEIFQEKGDTTRGIFMNLMKEGITRATKNISHGNVSHLEFGDFSLIFGHIHMLRPRHFMKNFSMISYSEKPTIVIGDFNSKNIFHRFMEQIGFTKIMHEKTFFPCNNISIFKNLLSMFIIPNPDVLYTKGFVYKNMEVLGQGNCLVASIKTIEHQIISHQRSDHSMIQAILYL